MSKASIEKLLDILSDLKLHINQANKQYYSKPINNHPRTIHDICHAVRAMLASTSLASVRQANNEDIYGAIAKDLGLEANNTNRAYAQKLCELYLLFHDSARQGEGEDLWDRDSAVNYYNYILSLGIDKEHARKMAEWGANKDFMQTIDQNTYYKLKTDDKGNISWEEDRSRNPNFLKAAIKVICDGDCADIIRVRGNNFDPKYLRIYQDYYKKFLEDGKLTHLKRLWSIIDELTGLIALHSQISDDDKNQEDIAYKILDTINKETIYIKHSFNNGEFLDNIDAQKIWQKDKFPTGRITEKSVQQDIIDGKVALRAIGDLYTIKQKGLTEVEMEIKKLNRKSGALRKNDPLHQLMLKRNPAHKSEKPEEYKYKLDGNPARSITIISRNTKLFKDNGIFLGFIRPKYEKISQVHESNQYTGFGKKSEYISELKTSELKLIIKEQIKNKIKLTSLNTYTRNHNEALMNITPDDLSCLFIPYQNIHKTLDKDRKLGIIDAYYARYQIQIYSGKLLPIFEFSISTNQVKEVFIDDHKIRKMIEEFYLETYLENPLYHRDKSFNEIIYKLNLKPVINSLYISEDNFNQSLKERKNQYIKDNPDYSLRKMIIFKYKTAEIVEFINSNQTKIKEYILSTDQYNYIIILLGNLTSFKPDEFEQIAQALYNIHQFKIDIKMLINLSKIITEYLNNPCIDSILIECQNLESLLSNKKISLLISENALECYKNSIDNPNFPSAKDLMKINSVDKLTQLLSPQALECYKKSSINDCFPNFDKLSILDSTTIKYLVDNKILSLYEEHKTNNAFPSFDDLLKVLQKKRKGFGNLNSQANNLKKFILLTSDVALECYREHAIDKSFPSFEKLCSLNYGKLEYFLRPDLIFYYKKLANNPYLPQFDDLIELETHQIDNLIYDKTLEYYKILKNHENEPEFAQLPKWNQLKTLGFLEIDLLISPEAIKLYKKSYNDKSFPSFEDLKDLEYDKLEALISKDAVTCYKKHKTNQIYPSFKLLKNSNSYYINSMISPEAQNLYEYAYKLNLTPELFWKYNRNDIKNRNYDVVKLKILFIKLLNEAALSGIKLPENYMSDFKNSISSISKKYPDKNKLTLDLEQNIDIIIKNLLEKLRNGENLGAAFEKTVDESFQKPEDSKFTTMIKSESTTQVILGNTPFFT